MKQTNKSYVVILKEGPGNWVLRMSIFQGTVEKMRSEFRTKTLERCLQAARVLQLHVDNEAELPLNVYRRAA